MNKLKKLIESTKVMDIKIKYGSDVIRFNLHEELKVNENILNEQIKEQPSHYSFLCLMLNKLDKIKDDKKAEMEKVQAELLLRNKSKIDPKTNRPYNNDLAEAMTIKSDKFQAAQARYFKAKESYGTIKAAVSGFEQRSSLLQSLSANVREERKHS